MGVTSDRVPGISANLSAFLGILSEGFEDAHYFLPHHEEHDHDLNSTLKERLSGESEHQHDNDLPSFILQKLFLPLYFLATLWDYAASHVHKDKSLHLTFQQAWCKQLSKIKKLLTYCY